LKYRRHERQALLDGLADQLADFVLVQQELPPALWIVVDVPPVRVGIDMDVVQPHIALLDARKGVSQVGAPLPDALDFGAEERDAGLEGLEHVVVVQGLAVVGDQRVFGLILRPWRHRRAPARRAASRTAATRLP
jgi:hypothetical protein